MKYYILVCALLLSCGVDVEQCPAHHREPPTITKHKTHVENRSFPTVSVDEDGETSVEMDDEDIDVCDADCPVCWQMHNNPCYSDCPGCEFIRRKQREAEEARKMKEGADVR